MTDRLYWLDCDGTAIKHAKHNSNLLTCRLLYSDHPVPTQFQFSPVNPNLVSWIRMKREITYLFYYVWIVFLHVNNFYSRYFTSIFKCSIFSESKCLLVLFMISLFFFLKIWKNWEENIRKIDKFKAITKFSILFFHQKSSSESLLLNCSIFFERKLYFVCVFKDSF